MQQAVEFCAVQSWCCAMSCHAKHMEDIIEPTSLGLYNFGKPRQQLDILALT